jgi:hypothetical protein
VVCGGSAAFNAIWGNRLPGQIHRHHVFARQFRQEFLRLGIQIDEYVVPMTPSAHGVIHNWWNQQWRAFFQDPNVTATDARLKAAEMWRRAGLGNLPVGFFER